ncbi:hypothetical protein C8R42DRAFT_686005 [Lentinula raphanica]|nr:hypothetical protein C8R42DRAFT_686005 [Lentinula raphanica]
MPSSISSIPLANIDELNKIWDADKRLPSLTSRRDWAMARNLTPTAVNEWWWTKRRRARDRGLPLHCADYHIPIGNPPTITGSSCKTEPIDEDVTSLEPSRNSSPSNLDDTLSIKLNSSSEASELSSPLPYEISRHTTPQSSSPPTSEQDEFPNVNICARINDDEHWAPQDYPSYDLQLSFENFHKEFLASQDAELCENEALQASPVLPPIQDAEHCENDFAAEVQLSPVLPPIQPCQTDDSNSSSNRLPAVFPSFCSLISLDDKTFASNEDAKHRENGLAVEVQVESPVLPPIQPCQTDDFNCSSNRLPSVFPSSRPLISLVSLDDKTFTSNGFYLAPTDETDKSQDSDVLIIKTPTIPCKPLELPLLLECSDTNYLPPLTTPDTEPLELPLLLELSDSTYLPPLTPIDTEPLELEDPFREPPFTLTHRWYSKHADSSDYDTISASDPGTDINSLEYHAFLKHLNLQWFGGEGWLVHNELYTPL